MTKYLRRHWVTNPKGVEISYKGAFDLDEFYEWLVRYLDFRAYWSDANETLYSEKIGSGGAKEIEIIWECSKNEGTRYKKKIIIKFIITGAKEIEVPAGDKRVKLTQAGYKIFLYAFLEVAEEKGFFGAVWDNLINKRVLDNHIRDTWQDFDKLHGEIKKIFDQYVQ